MRVRLASVVVGFAASLFFLVCSVAPLTAYAQSSTGSGGEAGTGAATSDVDAAASASPAGAADAGPAAPTPAPLAPAETTHPVSNSTQAEREAAERDRQRQEERAEAEDDGRDADILWLEAGFGYSWVDLVALSADNFLPSLDEKQGSGYTAHVAAGFRVFILTLGARGTLASYSGFDLWSVMLDVALRIPTPVIEPYLRVGVGYAFMGQADYDAPANSETSVYGYNLEAGLGLDIYLNKIISLGAGADFAFLNLTRQSADACRMSPGMCEPVDSVNFEEDGDAAGLQARAHGHVSLHF